MIRLVYAVKSNIHFPKRLKTYINWFFSSSMNNLTLISSYNLLLSLTNLPQIERNQIKINEA